MSAPPHVIKTFEKWNGTILHFCQNCHVEDDDLQKPCRPTVDADAAAVAAAAAAPPRLFPSPPRPYRVEQGSCARPGDPYMHFSLLVQAKSDSPKRHAAAARLMTLAQRYYVSGSVEKLCNSGGPAQFEVHFQGYSQAVTFVMKRGVTKGYYVELERASLPPCRCFDGEKFFMIRPPRTHKLPPAYDSQDPAPVPDFLTRGWVHRADTGLNQSDSAMEWPGSVEDEEAKER